MTTRATTAPDRAALMAEELVAYFKSTPCRYAGLRLDCGEAPPDVVPHFTQTLATRLGEALATTQSIGQGADGPRGKVTTVALALDQPATYDTLETTLKCLHGVNGDRDKHFLIVVVPHASNSNVDAAGSIFRHSPNPGDREPQYYSMSLGWYLTGRPA